MKKIIMLSKTFALSALLAFTTNCSNSSSAPMQVRCGYAVDHGPASGGTEISFTCATDKKEILPDIYITIGGKKLENIRSHRIDYFIHLYGNTPEGREGVAQIELWTAEGKAMTLLSKHTFTYTDDTNASLISKVKRMLVSSPWDEDKAKEYLNQLSKTSPEWKKYGATLSKQIDKRTESEEKRKKKSAGVHIGMTRQDVLDSMWGRPRSINKTRTAYGVHEQWCYDGNNFLYFENGILTAIQN
jgi:hypothetical protein